MEATVAERGQITLPKAVRDKLGLSPGTKLEVEIRNGQLLLRKKVSLQLGKWVGKFNLDGQSTDEVMQGLRGRPVPWTGSAADKKIFSLPHADAVKALKASRKKK